MARYREFDPAERLEKAKLLFWEKGYTDTSMRDLVKAMKLNPGSIYEAYGDKYSLFVQCLTKYADEKLQAYRMIARQAPSAVVALEHIIREGAAALLREGKSCMVVKSSFEFGTSDKKIHAILSGQANDIVALFEELIVAAQGDATIPPDRQPAEMARFIYSSFNGIWQYYMLFKDPAKIQVLVGQLVAEIQR